MIKIHVNILQACKLFKYLTPQQITKINDCIYNHNTTQTTTHHLPPRVRDHRSYQLA